MKAPTEMMGTERLARRVADSLWVVVFVVIGLQYLNVRAGPLTNWGGDFFGSMAVYGTLRTGGRRSNWLARMRPSPLWSAAIVLVGCIAWELGQISHVIPGRYDPWDIAAYVLGVAVVFTAEKVFLRRMQSAEA